MRVLISAASRHGATADISQHIADILTVRGLEATVADPMEVGDLDQFQAVVVGSAVYAGHWLREAKELVGRVIAHGGLDVWLFSSGGVGDPPVPDADPVEIADFSVLARAHDHRLFAGKIDMSTLNFGERAIMRAVRAQEGDFRPWEDIATWAGTIAEVLERRLVVSR